MVLLVATTAGAQGPRIPRGGTGEPGYWVGLSYGYLDGTSMNDGATNSRWAFGYSSQIRATLEKTIQRGVALGVSAGFATAPMTYQGFSSSCLGGCSATGDITQWLAFVHAGSGLGFHGMYNLEAGITQFGHFRDRATGADLSSGSSNDFTFGFGGGLGYGFAPNMDMYVGEQWDIILHSQGDETNADAPRQLTFRIGFRVGF
jgi:hypothetical protein